MGSYRRRLERLGDSYDDCSGCGYPSYRDVLARALKPAAIRTNVRTTTGPGDQSPDPEPCEICGRQKLRIKVRGLDA